MLERLESPDLQARLKKIRILILDVDGVMTDGRIFWLDGHGWTRHFHVKDGYGLKILMKAGIEVAVISGGDSKDVRTRMEFLKIPHIFLGDEDKLKALDKILKVTGFAPEQMAFMGDDLFDIPVMREGRLQRDGSSRRRARERARALHHPRRRRLGRGARDRRRGPQGAGPRALTE